MAHTAHRGRQRLPMLRPQLSPGQRFPGRPHAVIRFQLPAHRHHPHTTYRSGAHAPPAHPCRGLHRSGGDLSPFVEGLEELENYSRIWLLFVFHQTKEVRLKVIPHGQDHERGVFTTRAPCRPNGIGMSLVPLLRREGNFLYVDHVDMLDGTPLLDIKPHSPDLDSGAGL